MQILMASLEPSIIGTEYGKRRGKTEREREHRIEPRGIQHVRRGMESFRKTRKTLLGESPPMSLLGLHWSLQYQSGTIKSFLV